MRPPWVIRTNRAFRHLYPELEAGDLLLLRLAVKAEEEYLFTDLLARGIEAFPPLLAQHLARSKCFQAAVFREEMVPFTQVIRDRHDLIRAVNLYGQHGFKRVITKQNRFNCGLGIHLWEDIESLYNQATLGGFPYPFVLQPFVPEITDVRVVILGDYLEAYARKNPHNFRHNIFFGGEARPYELSNEELALCQRVMGRGQFPYAHLDLMITPEGKVYLSEINLRGGLKGAQIEPPLYQEKIKALEEAFLREWLSQHPQAEIKT